MGILDRHDNRQQGLLYARGLEPGARTLVVRDYGSDTASAFVARGHRRRHWFPHRIVRVPKGGPDGLKLARRMWRADARPDELWELLLSALPPVRDEIPAELFSDDELVWHRQQFGLAGHVAAAALAVRGDEVVITTSVSDLVQRIGRQRQHKTQVENRFAGWARLIVHAALGFAQDRDAARVLLPTADLVLANTDPARTVGRALFDRVYDGIVGAPFVARRSGGWWVLDVAENAGALVRVEAKALPLESGPQVLLCHDIEQGWGHLHAPQLADAMQRSAPNHLERMLGIEAARGMRATYSVVGVLLPELEGRLRAGGHAVAFHSFDHAVAGDEGLDDQLWKCRELDYRIKGYRPAQSRLTNELTDDNLALHNFEWLASSRWSLDLSEPVLRNGIVLVPILLDDFALHNGADYPTWEAESVATLAGHRTATLSLHDCYADRWLDHYSDLLAKVGELGTIRTVDELAADVLLSHSE